VTACPEPSPPTAVTLRRVALAASVLFDVDLVPDDDGVVLPGPPDVHVAWLQLRRAMAGHDPDGATARERVACWLLGRRWVADVDPDDLSARARPLGLPVDHVLHPGLDWVEMRVLGGALDVGLGFVGLDPRRPDDVVPLTRELLAEPAVAVEPLWRGAVAYLERMGAMAADRLDRQPAAPLRPMGDCDVVTLRASATFRSALAAGAQGMRALAVPMRTRGWLDLSRIDPAFVVAAAAATEPADRGFNRPLLLTRDEVTLSLEGGRPAEIVLRDPPPQRQWLRDVLYHR
jgi:hypothetical protein